MTPEEKARVKIDRWFADAGWLVVNRLGSFVIPQEYLVFFYQNTLLITM